MYDNFPVFNSNFNPSTGDCVVAGLNFNNFAASGFATRDCTGDTVNGRAKVLCVGKQVTGKQTNMILAENLWMFSFAAFFFFEVLVSMNKVYRNCTNC